MALGSRVGVRFLILTVAALAVIFSTTYILQYLTSALSGTKPEQGKRKIDIANTTLLSWKPRLIRYSNLLTIAECDHIVELGRGKVQQSLTVGPNGTAVVNPHRSSYGYFLNRESQHDPVIIGIENRLFEWTQIPKENGEAMNLLWYRIGQEYKPHFDYFSGDEWLRHGGNRLATVLMYLSDVEDGGETIFPSAEGGQIKVKPRKGDAVLFYSLTTENKPDSFSLHGSVPVIKGDKWAMTKWFREKRFE